MTDTTRKSPTFEYVDAIAILELDDACDTTVAAGRLIGCSDTVVHEARKSGRVRKVNELAAERALQHINKGAADAEEALAMFELALSFMKAHPLDLPAELYGKMGTPLRDLIKGA